MADLSTIAQKLLADGPHKVEPSPRRIRIILGGAQLVDTTYAQYVWEHPYFPQYYIPSSDLTATPTFTEQKGYKLLTFEINGKKYEDHAVLISEGPMKKHVRFDFKKMDEWLEEDEPIYVHPKDPYKRVDVRQSTRSVRVEVEGVTVAESSWGSHLFETGLPVRYYLPKSAVKDWALLRPSKTVTSCPYKGDAEYYDVVLPDGKVIQDVIWWYKFPILEVADIQGKLCFYNERVDIWLDGVKLDRPKSKFG